MNKAAGFTLIELMVAVAIVGILTTIAVGSYKDSIAKSRRSEAAAALVEGAQLLERQYSVAGHYTDAVGDSAPKAVLVTTQLPPKSTSPYYTISVTGDDSTFTLTATAKGAMASDKCGNLTLDQNGAQKITATGTGMTKEDCWRR